MSKPSHTIPAALGGDPLSTTPLRMVRPSFPPLCQQAFQQMLSSGQVTNHGPYVQKFEALLTAYTGVPTITTTNGQSALMLMMRAAGIDGGEVIVPSYTFCGTPHAVRWCGAQPIFADIGPGDSLCIDPEDVERKITPWTRAVLAVDVYGIACDYEALQRLGEKYGVKILFDSAPAFGTKVNGQPIGAFGDAQIFSFHATKAFSTMEGGGLASSHADLVERAAALRNFGQGEGADCQEAGLNAKMLEVCALLGLEQLKHFDDVVRHRAKIAEAYRTGLAHIAGLSFTSPPPNQLPVWLYFPVIIDPLVFGMDRDVLVMALACENLHVRKYFERPCHHMAAYRAATEIHLPRTEAVAYNVISLPIYNNMALEECAVFLAAFERIHRHARRIREVLTRSTI